MGKETRRGFLKLCAAGALSVAPLGVLWTRSEGESDGSQLIIRIRPVTPHHCSPSFRRYCERATFRTVDEALQVSRRTPHAYVVYPVLPGSNPHQGPQGSGLPGV